MHVVGYVCPTDITDHYICLLSIALTTGKTLKQSCIKIDNDGVANDLSSADWLAVTNTNDVNEAAELFNAIITSTVANHTKRVLISRSKLIFKLWITHKGTEIVCICRPNNFPIII
jgi:hypothetical protein